MAARPGAITPCAEAGGRGSTIWKRPRNQTATAWPCP